MMKWIAPTPPAVVTPGTNFATKGCDFLAQKMKGMLHRYYHATSYKDRNGPSHTLASQVSVEDDLAAERFLRPILTQLAEIATGSRANKKRLPKADHQEKATTGKKKKKQ